MINDHQDPRVEIRKLQRADEAQACAQFMANAEPWVTLRRSYGESVTMLNDPFREVYVAIVEDQVVGFTILQMRGAFVGYIQTVGVMPEWRNRGIGSKLIKFAEERIFRETPNIFICVSSFNAGAQRLYQRLGYQVIGELKNYIVPGHSEILMRKTIAPLTEFSSSKRPRHNYFSTYFIDRVSGRRLDDEWLAAQLEDDTTRFIPVWKLHNLFATEQAPKPVYLAPVDIRDYVPTAQATILLGVKAGRTYFAVDLPSQETSPPNGLAELGEFRDLRGVASLLDEQDGALLAYARAMTYWHCRHRFCGECGNPTRSAEGGYLRVCTNSQCGHQHFPRTDPAIIVLVTLGERCLLGRKPEWPEGLYSTIAGFVEPGESLEDALVREVREETGVEVDEMTYHSSQPWPFPSSLMLGFTAVASQGVIRIDEDELENACWLTREEMQDKLMRGALRLPMSVSVAYRLIEDWFNAGNLGQLSSIRDRA